MRVLVCGGRDYNDRTAAFRALDRLRNVEVIIHGGARGADTLAELWACYRGIPFEVYRADWDKYGKAAGHLRNQQMLDEGRPGGVVAFPGGRGTADMVRRATAAGLKVWQPYPG